MRAAISTREPDPDALIRRANEIPGMSGQNLAKIVTTQEPYRWEDNRPAYINPDFSPLDKGIWQHRGDKPSVVAMDFGIKFNILRLLSEAGFEVIIVPGFHRCRSYSSHATRWYLFVQRAG